MQPHASIPHQKSHPNQAGVKPGPGTDHLQKVAGFMTKHGIAGLPRNYHLVHEALHGHNAGLARDLAALAQRPTQHALDQLGLKHRLASHCWLAEERLQSESAALLHNLGDHLGLGILHKQTFARALETITRSIREDETRGIGELIAELDFLAAAAADLLQAETELAVKLKNGLQQIEAADRAAEAAKVMKAKDGLTGLPNRLARIGAGYTERGLRLGQEFHRRIGVVAERDADRQAEPTVLGTVLGGEDQIVFDGAMQAFGDRISILARNVAE